MKSSLLVRLKRASVVWGLFKLRYAAAGCCWAVVMTLIVISGAPRANPNDWIVTSMDGRLNAGGIGGIGLISVGGVGGAGGNPESSGGGGGGGGSYGRDGGMGSIFPLWGFLPGGVGVEHGNGGPGEESEFRGNDRIGGGGGGGGGTGGSSSAINLESLSGGAGGAGGSGYQSGGGGGGGGGGIGFIFSGGTSSYINSGQIIGGAGGNGGYGFQGGQGGMGGVGVTFSQGGVVFENEGFIQGGAGGAGGAHSALGVYAGMGGNGGAGVYGSNLNITNFASITGGTGGAGGGNGGAAIFGDHLSIVNYTFYAFIEGGAGGAGGGSGGAAISGDSLFVSNEWGSIKGGAGYQAEAPNSNALVGSGGAGVSGTNLVIDNHSASIYGGNGGVNTIGVGGDAISGSHLNIANDSIISGGAGGLPFNSLNLGVAGNGGAGIAGNYLVIVNNAGYISGGEGRVGGVGISGDNIVISNVGEAFISGGVGVSGGAGINGNNLSVINNVGALITGGNGATGFSGGPGILVLSRPSPTQITNFGTIAGGTGGVAGAGIQSSGLIDTITNMGSIHAGASSANGIINYGLITNLNNLQGASASGSTPLSLVGNLPTRYNAIFNGASAYGQLLIDGAVGSMRFNIYGNTGTTLIDGVAPSRLVAGTYTGVLQGFSAVGFLGSTGIYNGLNYSLVADSGCSGCWNLVVTPALTGAIGAGGNYLSAVGSTLHPIFSSGTLSLLNGDSSSQNFTVDGAGGNLQSPARGSATLSGAISGAGAMTFSGAGTTYMNGVNTYTGGTTVAGGTLSVGSSEANTTARLAGDVAVSTAGTLAGHGGIGGSVNNGGVVAPGGSIGTLTVAGNYVQNSSGTLSISITPTANSILAVVGAASIAGNFVIDASNGIYSKRKYTVLTSTGLTGTFSGVSGNLASYSPLGSILSYDANNVYLSLVASTADTQESLVNTAAVLQGVYTLQNSVLANSFSYDCNLFGESDVCVSAGGRNTAVQAEGVNNTGGLLIAAYRPHLNYRIGAYADQNLSTNSPGGTVKLGNNTPLIGLFGAWNENQDGTGTEVKVSAAYGQKNATVTRSVVGTSDPGAGSSNLVSQGAQVQLKYGFRLNQDIIVSPYVGMRYTQSNMGGYSESASATVTSPLTYSALNTNATTALAGLGASYRFIPQATVFASAGIETDTNTANGTYSASGLAGLTPINFNANPVKTRPTATLGASYDVEKNQRVGITGIYRQEPFQAVSTTTVMATYTIGM